MLCILTELNNKRILYYIAKLRSWAHCTLCVCDRISYALDDNNSHKS